MNYPTVVNDIDFRNFVFLSGSQTMTDTKKVAEAFGKDHKDVLRKTRAVIRQCSVGFAERNFTLCFENNELQNGKPQPVYQVTRDGWMMLVMGFTGKAATAIKEQYIAAFNWMAEQLAHRMATGEEMQHRYAIKEARSKLKGAIGSRLMNERKKEKRLLAIEYGRITQATQPELFVAG